MRTLLLVVSGALTAGPALAQDADCADFKWPVRRELAAFKDEGLPTVAAADTYQVTLSGDAWVDVVQDGKVLKQVGFTGSHSCKAVRKSVRFAIGTAPTTIEISDAGADTLKLEVLPKEQ